MTPQTVFIILVAIIVANFFIENCLELLNLKNLSEHLPDELKDLYDADRYRKSQNYERVNTRFGLVTGSFNLLLILGMFFFDGFARVDAIATSISAHPVVQPLLFFAILGLALDLVNTPFAAYNTFSIEQRFGFNKTTPRTFVTDKLKGWILTAIIGGGIMALVIWFYMRTGAYFWLWAWLLISVFSLFMAFFYSSLIVPLFNKQKPLDDGELRQSITHHAEQAGLHVNSIYTIDGSKRSTKANAYFSGMGRKRRIVLYDTLMNELTTGELVAVLMHETGHYRLRHIVSGITLSFLQSGVMLYILSLFISQPALSQALGVDTASFHIGLVAFGVLYSPVSVVLGLMMNALSRKHEYSADAFAAKLGMAPDLVSALRKLSINNLTNLTPHPAYVFFHFSHPTLLQRIRKLNV